MKIEKIKYWTLTKKADAHYEDGTGIYRTDRVEMQICGYCFKALYETADTYLMKQPDGPMVRVHPECKVDAIVNNKDIAHS